MKGKRNWRLLTALLCLSGPGIASGQILGTESEDAQLPGVVVESVAEDFSGAKPALLPGDVLLTWERLSRPAGSSGASAGQFSSPIDWLELKYESKKPVVVKLSGERGGTPMAWRFEWTRFIGEWASAPRVRPRGPQEFVHAYLRGLKQIEAGNVEEGLSTWEELSREWEARSDSPLHIWLLTRRVQVLRADRQWHRAQAAAVPLGWHPKSWVEFESFVGRPPRYLTHKQFELLDYLDTRDAAEGVGTETPEKPDNLWIAMHLNSEPFLLDAGHYLRSPGATNQGRLRNFHSPLFGIPSNHRFELVNTSRDFSPSTSSRLAAILGNLAGFAEVGSPIAAEIYSEGSLRFYSLPAEDHTESAKAQELLTLARSYLVWGLRSQKQEDPEGIARSLALFELSRVKRAQGFSKKAAKLLRRALRIADIRVGQPILPRETEGMVRSWVLYPLYQESVSLQLERGRPRRAFVQLEHSRAQGYNARLAEREMVFAQLPPRLRRKRRHLARRYDRTIRSLQRLPPRRSAAKIRRVQARQIQIRKLQEDIEVELRSKTPEPEQLPLRFRQLKKLLDPGSVFVAYSVGDEDTVIFVLRSGQRLSAHSIAIGRAQLKERTELFLRQIYAASPLPRLSQDARELYQLLLAPAEDAIANSERIILAPDGPLLQLPFGSLMRPNGRFVAEWKPLSHTLSATVWAAIRNQHASSAARRLSSTAKPTLLAFGDPEFPSVRNGQRRSHSHLRSLDISSRDCFGERWDPLPFTRYEVEGIAELFGEDDARVVLGPQATEERLKSLGEVPRIIHVATHACVDNKLPWNSSIILSLPEGGSPDRDNGLLQAWEIMEHLRIDADLVTLSACQTAAGQVRHGEGIMSLTRAFQIAGARSVLASLWNVEDKATAEFMIRFYRHLLDGKPKDEALQAAKIELIRGPIEVGAEDGTKRQIDASAPFFWAAFQLHGDWQ